MSFSMVEILSSLRRSVSEARLKRRWERLQSLGMKIGSDVWLPASTWIDTDHCFLVSIADHCGFGEECMLLAHDAQMDEFLDCARIGRVRIHESCHIGARSVILPGVDIGPRTIVGACSVVSKTLPPNTVCAGSPAKPICSLDEYLDKHRANREKSPVFQFLEYDRAYLTPEKQAELVEKTLQSDAYIVGGRSAELDGRGATLRTPEQKTPKDE